MENALLQTGFAILIPVRVSSLSDLDGLPESLFVILETFQNSRAVIVDDSAPMFFAYHKQLFNHERISHFSGQDKFKTGLNNKMNAIECGLAQISEEYVFYTDDDIRLRPETVLAALHELQNFDSVSCSVMYIKPNLSDLLNLVSEFWAHAIDNSAQPFGHCFFRSSTLKRIGFPSKNVIFDDYEFVRHFSRNGATNKFLGEVVLDAVTKGWKQFWKQRIIYAYEMLIDPIYFGILIVQVPILAMLFLRNPAYSLYWFFLITGIVVSIAYVGREKFLKARTQWWHPILAIPSLSIYMVSAWPALFLFLTVGVKFGPNRIKGLPKR